MKSLLHLLIIAYFIPVGALAQWEVVPLDSSENLFDIYFLDQSTGWIAGNASILKTVDGGSSWNYMIDPNDSTTRYYDIYFKDSQNGWAVGKSISSVSGRVRFTTDGGETWQTYYTGGSLPWWSIDFANNNQGVIVGQEGQILYTSDGGSTWLNRFSPAGDLGIIKDVEFYDGLNGIAVGYSSPSVGVIIKTNDGGNTWVHINTDILGLNAVSFKNSTIGVAVGINGSIYRTEDGGNSWTEIPNNISQYLHAVHFNGSKVIAVGSMGAILKSYDSGLTWYPDQFDSTADFKGVFQNSSNSAFAVGSFGEVITYCDECNSMAVFNINHQETEELEMENLSIAADNSTSTKFQFSGTDFQNVSLRIKEDENSDNTSIWGNFTSRLEENDYTEFIYSHPQYFDIAGEKEKEATIQVYNTITNDTITEYSFKIVRPSVLLVHGIWSDGDVFNDSEDFFGNTIIGLENRLLNSNMYNAHQILKAYYKSDAFNFENVPRMILQIKTLKYLARRKNISLGKIDVLAHSNGGLLSRLYIQSVQYKNDINKLITFNTPHAGSQFADLLLDPNYFFLHPILEALEHSPTNGVISDLSVEGNFISDLRVSEQTNPSDVSLHTLTSTKTTGLTGDLIQIGWNYIVNRYMLFHLQIDNPQNYLNDLFNNDTSDLIVASNSQTGGLSTTHSTNTEDQSHIGSTSNEEMANNAINLLNSNPNNINKFKIGGFQPQVLNYDFNNGTSGRSSFQQSNETLSILSPLEATEYNAGDTVTINVNGSSGIQNILSSMGNIKIPLQNHVIENSSTDNFDFTIPNNALGRLNIVSVGFDANGYADFDSTYIIVNTNAQLQSIEIVQNLIYVPEGRQEFITILGNYEDGITRDITYVNGLSYTFHNQNAEILEAGLVNGLIEGEDLLTVTYQGESATVPITIANASEWVEVTLSNEELSIQDNSLTVFPNPTNEIVNINFSGIITKARIIIYDSTGNLIVSDEIENTQTTNINISKFTAGVYFVKIETNEKSVTKKIIKK